MSLNRDEIAAQIERESPGLQPIMYTALAELVERFMKPHLVELEAVKAKLAALENSPRGESPDVGQQLQRDYPGLWSGFIACRSCKLRGRCQVNCPECGGCGYVKS